MMDLHEASLGDASYRAPTGSPLGNPRVPTHSTDARIVLTLVGGDEAKIYGSPEAAGRCMAEYEHRAVLLRGPDGALPRQDQTAAATTASKKRRDRRKKKQAETEQDKATREAQAAQETNLGRSEDDDDDDEAESEHRAIATPSGSQLWSEDEGVMDDRSCAYLDEGTEGEGAEEAQGMVGTAR